MQNNGYLEMISPPQPQNRPSCQKASRKIWHNWKLQGNPFLDVIIVPSLKAIIEETPLTSINPLGIQTLLNLSEITQNGFFVPPPRKGRQPDSQNAVSRRTITSDPRFSQLFQIITLSFLKTPFQVSTIYPSIGSGGTPNISGSERVIAKRGHTNSPFYQRRFLQPPVSCTQKGRIYVKTRFARSSGSE